MKKTLIFLSCLALLTNARANDPAREVLEKTVARLNAIRTVRYSYYREINNFKDNYFAKNKGDCYFEFSGSPVPARFRFEDESAIQVYNGSEYFRLDRSKKEYTAEQKNIDRLGSLSLMYHSIPTLRIGLNLVAKDPAVQKELSDTLIGDRRFSLIRFRLQDKGFEFPAGFQQYTAKVTKYYELVIDPATALPHILIDRNSIMADQYFVKTVYSNFDLQPAAPAPSSWFYSSYKGYTLKADEKRIPLITAGAVLPSWSLPQYTGGVINDSQLRGKPVLMDFWIKNCGYCMQSFPHLKSLQEKYGKQVQIITVNAYDSREDVGFFYKREQPAYAMIYNGEALARKLGIYGYPTVVLLDRDGKVQHVGAFNHAELDRLLGKLVQGG